MTRPNLPRISDNEDFLKSLATLTKKAKCKLTVCPEEENVDDQWMQVRTCSHRPEAKGQTQALGSWGTAPALRRSFLGWTERKEPQKILTLGTEQESSREFI